MKRLVPMTIGYRVSDEQIRLIRGSDISAMSAFYFDNEVMLRRKVVRFLREKKLPLYDSRYSADDLMQQLFLDLPYLNYKNCYVFGLSLVYSFERSLFGGYRCKPTMLGSRLCNYTRNSEDGETKTDAFLFDTLASSESAEEQYFKQCSTSEPDNFSENLKDRLTEWLKSHLPTGDFEIVCSFVFLSHTDRELQQYFGYSEFTDLSRRYDKAISLLRPYYREILKLVNSHGKYDYLLNETPALFERMRIAMTGFKLRG